ncbi:hypothetical protein G6F64_015001 [Rhizopus arrhizus]|uniref:Uncharacterized protein n=1 Tax=Rhizopus oryzae TaxID=64495 RepID=A0A9P7BIY7_RHIOR|nr:hypothetical protein G6F64_015001 [Rhizopus arrhizus]
MGSSILGYSRTVRREYEIRPISTMISDRTDANTGRLMQVSEIRIALSPRKKKGRLHEPPPTTSTVAPSVTRCMPATTSLSPAATPVRISTRPSRRSPMVTSRRSARPSLIR